MKPLSLPQSLTLAEFLAKHFAGLRKEQLNPEAAADMTIGERFAVKFGGRVAAWVSLPNPATRASVKNQAAFLAWVKAKLPDGVETVEQVREATQKKLLEQAKAGGWPNPETGEREAIPGVEVSDGEPSPRVELQDCAGEAIGAAWRAGDIDLGGMLALPVAEAGDAS